MGSMLIELFIESKTVDPKQLIVTNRTISKVEALKEKYPQLIIAQSPTTVAEKAELLFLCVKPMDMLPILKQIAPILSKEQCVVSITSPISIQQLEIAVPCSTARIIPSITNRARAGVTLVTFGERCTTPWKETLLRIINGISKPFFIDENITRIASDIVSCGPAFFTYLLRRFIEAAVEETDIDEETAIQLGSEMVIGLGELLKQKHYTLASLQEKVTVQGGVTGAGIEILKQEVGDMFHQLIQATHRKYADDKKEISNYLSP